MSMSLALSICVLFISFMQSVSGAKYLVIIFFILLWFAPAATVFRTVMLHSQVYIYHYNHINLTLALNH